MSNVKTPIDSFEVRDLEDNSTIQVHVESCTEVGNAGKPGIRDQELLKSAVMQAEQGLASGYLHAFPFEMAAAYGFHLAKNHPFIDGNKRVAWSVLRVFLFQNGYVIRRPNAEQAQAMVDVAAGRLEKSALARWIERNAVKVQEKS